ncbi:MAG TPA: beta-galactosidase [Abditibacteriaceae bacterium]
MKHTFVISDNDFLLDGRPFVIRCGEIHYTRVPPEYWTHRLQMCKAMGLNTVCVYLFWNFHEWEQGQFNWSGWADVAEFCRLAQREGLWVMLRPGPYSCAEWEMGGLPWWLVKKDGIKLRTTDPDFLEPATRYLKEVGRVLGPLQVTRGGPLLMVQVENEYGSFGQDAGYMGALRQALLDGGFDVPLFACNPPGDIAKGFRPDLFQVVNFGPGNAQSAFETLRKHQPTGPLMNGEYYPAWFDTWGTPHHYGNVEGYLSDLEYMVQNNRSFSIYMAHGGTSFGLWAGADRPFRPDTTSYDYDAPISEAGWTTQKFTRTREVFSKYLLPGEDLPEPPPQNPIIVIESFTLKEVAPVLDNLPQPVLDERPQTMEFYQDRGCILYRTTVPAGPAAELTVQAAHDFGWVFLDGQQLGIMNRRMRRYRVSLPERTAPARLDVLVEAMGRVNFGREVFDRKGLHAPVQLLTGDGETTELLDWQIFPLPLDAAHLASLNFHEEADNSQALTAPTFWRGSFEVPEPGDTFLDVRTWGKGVLWVNGHCLGRFWNIGPTQTMYCPGVWLRAGHNDVVVLDLLGPQEPQLAGLTQPILDEVRLELDWARPVRAKGTFGVEGIAPAAEGTFSNESDWQEVHFTKPQQGRYLCIETLNAHKGEPFAAIAELDARDAQGQSLVKAHWKILWVDSEETMADDGSAENAIDGQSASIWHSEYGGKKPDHPHYLVIDLGTSSAIGSIRYLPRSGDTSVNGRIKDYRVYLSDVPFGLTID